MHGTDTIMNKEQVKFLLPVLPETLISVFATSKHEYQNRLTILPVVDLVFEAQSVTPTKNLGCGVSIRGAGEDSGACVGGTDSKLGPLCDEQLNLLCILG